MAQTSNPEVSISLVAPQSIDVEFSGYALLPSTFPSADISVYSKGPALPVTPTKRSRKLSRKAQKDNGKRAKTSHAPAATGISDGAPELDNDEEPSLPSQVVELSLPPQVVEPSLPPQVDDNGYQHYVDATLADAAGFCQISTTFFVAQGWDARAMAATRTWYHIQKSRQGGRNVYICLCPWAGVDCVHLRFLSDYGSEKFPEDEIFNKTDDSVVLFSRQLIDVDIYRDEFSVHSPHHRGAKGRAVVCHEGQTTGRGTWTCTKDPLGNCAHINLARHQLQKLLKADPSAIDEGDHGGEMFDGPAPRVRAASGGESSVSYLPILPPAWAYIPSDTALYKRPSPLSKSLTIIPLSDLGACVCHSVYDPTVPVVKRRCTIYGLSGSMTADIELQPCLNCAAERRRFIGPDCREMGLFNFNNRALFTHDLLDEYTSTYTSSETPFTAWVGVTARRYVGQESAVEFVSDQVFRAVWFAYVRLQALDDDMVCQECGDTPEDTIWDGVTLSFSRKHLLPSLRPPTISHNQSAIRSSAYLSQQQLLPNIATRRLLRKVVSGRSLILQSGESLTRITPAERPQEIEVEDTEDEAAENPLVADTAGPSRLGAKASAEILARITAVPEVADLLQKINVSLGTLFLEHYGPIALLRGHDAPACYKRLFIQIAAEESVMQLVTRPALEALGQFNSNPTSHYASLLVGIPAVYDILVYEERNGWKGSYSPTVRGLCQWIYDRGKTVLLKLIIHDIPPLKTDNSMRDNDWRVTGCCYSMPEIRHRPKYPGLKHDLRNEPGGGRGGKCSKYYSQYGENRLTGGIMCVWCTHSICYGFHCIPRGEGRNDVFSAIITRWRKPPKRIIYDFACALGPYCMTREPHFFADTMFLIDNFHAKGHTKCAPAAFLSTYSDVDPALAFINSSAAECGNSGIKRIRKSVSYMAQDRAVLYTKVFLSIWNRLKIRRMVGIDR